ncbi:peptide chain release factor 1, mitochondrial [Paroedura picta]|uniref:peptide chain release factor 1, mitochondrial n=1 Tax=Paroedura picta TaxID=143630 RepID=UPI0040570C78
MLAGMSLCRTWFSHCCGPRCSLSFLAKRILHLADLNSFQHSSLQNAVASVLVTNWARRYHQTSRTLWDHEALQKYLQTLSQECQRITQLLDDCSLSEHRRKALAKRHTELSPLAEIFEETEKAKNEIQDLEALCAKLNTTEERQLLELALEEKEAVGQRINALWRKLFQVLLPREKYDSCDAVLEVTSGRTTGGDICQQFTQEVFEMYQGYARFKGWTFETLNYSATGYGGIHHAAARISGDNVYRHLKYEGGMHRVQRIPETGLSSRMQRIHTGTMSVIVFPQVEEVTINVDPRDLRIDTFRARGAGGQHVNTTDSAVRIVHIPTGITVECQQDRSQLLNKETALRTLQEKLYRQAIDKELSERSSARKLQLGTRAQSERIRTYNFNQDRVTDHRISYEARDIKEFLCGGEQLDDLISRLLEVAEIESLTEHLEQNCKLLRGDS